MTCILLGSVTKSSAVSFDLSPDDSLCLRQEVRAGDMVNGHYKIGPQVGVLKTEVSIKVRQISVVCLSI